MQKFCVSSLRRAADSEHFYRVVSESIDWDAQNLRQERTIPTPSSNSDLYDPFLGISLANANLESSLMIIPNYKANNNFLQAKWEDEARTFFFKTEKSQLGFPYIKGLVFKRFNSQNQYMSSVTHFNTTFLELCEQHMFFKSSNWPLLQSQPPSFDALKS